MRHLDRLQVADLTVKFDMKQLLLHLAVLRRRIFGFDEGPENRGEQVLGLGGSYHVSGALAP